MVNQRSENNLVSVIIPMYNAGKYIGRTIESVLAQRYPHFEILVSDDGSTDDGTDIVKNYRAQYPSKIRFFHHEDNANRGIGATRNLSIKHARGKYLAFLDADDEWFPHKLERQINIFHKNPDIALVYGRGRYVNSEGVPILFNGRNEIGSGAREGFPERKFSELLSDNNIPTSSVLVRYSCVQEVGFFNEKPLHHHEDWLLWSKLAYYYKFIYDPELVFRYRIYSGSYSDNLKKYMVDFSAEVNFIIALFTFLFENNPHKEIELRQLLHKSVRRLMMRARSWNLTIQEIENLVNPIGKYFPEILGNIRKNKFILSLVHPRIAALGRRIRHVIY